VRRVSPSPPPPVLNHAAPPPSYSSQTLVVPCGVASLSDVSTRTQEDLMESFFLSETLKYLYLLFDPGGCGLVVRGQTALNAGGGGSSGGHSFSQILTL
jgi:hypothetical protein